MEDYELIDAGGGARLERFGPYVVDRPHGAAWAERGDPARWAAADLRFDRDRGWTGPAAGNALTGWSITFQGLTLELRPTDAGQVGVFPEHGQTVPWLTKAVAGRTDPTVLHLFAYTGLVTLALARAGAATTHVDASRPSVSWARRNAEANGLADRPIRWIVEDARAYVERETRRGRRYDGIVLDPPTYGHGTGKSAWRLDEDLEPLLERAASLLAPGGFVLLTAHTEGYGSDRLATLLGQVSSVGSAGDLEIAAVSGGTLTLGAYAFAEGRP